MKLLRQFNSFFLRRKLDAEMAEEIRLHVEQRTEENLAAGMSPEEARWAALRIFGGVEQAKERVREQWVGRWLEDGMKDVRFAARQLRRSAGFAVTVILILAFGIGATTAIFSIVNSLVLKPLPYDQPGQLVRIFEAARPGEQNAVSVGVFLDWREQTRLFESIAAYSSTALNFSSEVDPERINGLRMTAKALQLLRARPILGRTFSSDEEQPGRNNVIVLTHQLWQRRFGGDADVVGRELLINDAAFTVVGVLPADFLPFPDQEFVIPFGFRAKDRDSRDSHWLSVLGRLRPGVSLAQAEADLTAVVESNRSLYPAWKRDWGVATVSMQEELASDIEPALLVLLGAVGLVLLIACTNVANLLLVRASARQREISVRAALGASRGRIVRQLLAESLLLSLVGCVAGLLLAAASLGGLRHVLGGMNLARVHEIALDPLVLAVAVLLALLTGIGFGLAPALQTTRRNFGLALKDGGRGSGASGTRLRSGLIVGEFALALALLIGAGLLLHSFARILEAPVGFEPAHALTAQLTLSGQKYPNVERIAAFYSSAAERVAALPGVEAAGINVSVPLTGNGYDRFFRIEGRANQPEPGYDIDFDFCTSDYFRAMGVPLIRGRFFTPAEVLSGVPVAIINQAAANKYFPGEDPIGCRIGHDGNYWEIVGIVGDMRLRSVLRPASPMVYRPRSSDAWRDAVLVVRVAGAPLAFAESVREAIREIDPAQPLARVQSLEQIVAASIADRRLTLGLLGGFAGVALFLAATGLYGVIAYAAAQRQREFGIRVALGASSAQVRALVLRHGLKLAVLGMAIGLASAFVLARLLGHLLYEIKPSDPITFAAVSVLLLLVAILASWLPARRAAKVNPVVALRAE